MTWLQFGLYCRRVVRNTKVTCHTHQYHRYSRLKNCVLILRLQNQCMQQTMCWRICHVATLHNCNIICVIMLNSQMYWVCVTNKLLLYHAIYSMDIMTWILVHIQLKGCYPPMVHLHCTKHSRLIQSHSTFTCTSCQLYQHDNHMHLCHTKTINKDKYSYLLNSPSLSSQNCMHTG